MEILDKLLDKKNKLLENMIIKDNQTKMNNINKKDNHKEALYKDIRYREISNPNSKEYKDEINNTKVKSSLNSNLKENYRTNENYKKVLDKIDPDNKELLNLKDNNINAARINYLRKRKDDNL